MRKKVRLADIYVKIYNKRTLTMDDLTFLSKYDPECFAKTCQNLVYNVPEAKKLMQPEPNQGEERKEEAEEKNIPESSKVDILLNNLKKMEMKELPVKNISTENVKDLLGNLYMEMLFPHNDKEQYFGMEKEQEESRFNKKV